MNARLNLIQACSRVHTLLSMLAIAVVVAGVLGFAAQSNTLASRKIEPSKPTQDYALEWRLDEHKLRYFENSASSAAQWSFDAYACRNSGTSELAPGRWRVVALSYNAGRDAHISLAPIEAGETRATGADTHPYNLIACGERGTRDAVALPAHTLAWLAARNGGVVNVRP